MAGACPIVLCLKKSRKKKKWHVFLEILLSPCAHLAELVLCWPLDKPEELSYSAAPGEVSGVVVAPCLARGSMRLSVSSLSISCFLQYTVRILSPAPP